MAPSSALTGEALARALAARSDAELRALLQVRPDLATPPPSSMTALAARAASRPSVERALAGLDQFQLDVTESLVALSPRGPAAAPDVATALAAPEPATAAVLTHLEELALVVDGVPVSTVAEALGPHPAGLGPPLADLPDGSAPAPTASTELQELLAQAPPAARRMLEALTWGPPVGTVSAGSDSPGARWLLDHGILRRVSATQLVLPLEVGLAARAGRTHRTVALEPPVAELPVRPAAVVAAEGARSAEEVVRLARELLTTWADDPPLALRSGGLGVRELRRAAGALETQPGTATTVVELVGMAGLVAPYETGEENVWAPTLSAADWLDEPLGVQWAALAGSWLASSRTPWLVGTRNDHGALRAALEPGLERAWAGRLRRRALLALAGLDDGAAPSTTQLHAVISWHSPRAAPPESALTAVLTEAELLGVTGAGALGGAGRALVSGADAGAALEADLPEPVGELLVQGDLTGVVPGRPTPELGHLLELASEVESRGSALTVRFTGDSVRRALDSGMTGEELLDALRSASRTPLPQPLEYLITDAARRHGQLRVGAAVSYVRVQDASAASALLNDPQLAVLQLRPLAPTVLVSSAGPGELLEALRSAGAAPVLEGPDGAVVAGRRSVATGGRVSASASRERRGRGRSSARAGNGAAVHVRRPTDTDLTELVERMRAGEERAREQAAARAAGGPARTDPVHALALLRDAAAAGSPVELEMIGATGRPQRRRVQPLTVDGGRVRMRDLDRDTEITVAVHRISAVGTG